jgi:hypothetical protein
MIPGGRSCPQRTPWCRKGSANSGKLRRERKADPHIKFLGTGHEAEVHMQPPLPIMASSLSRSHSSQNLPRARLSARNRYAKTIVTTLCAVVLTLSRCAASDEDWTVVTLSRNGSWGVASASSQPVAMAAAIASCRVMAGAASDCGAKFRASRGEWIIANLCGSHRIIAVGRSLDGAERDALNFEISLQLVYAPDLPPCKRLLTVDPDGAAVRPGQGYSAASQEGLGGAVNS